ncbi:MAG: phenylalanine--tRNA ligase subunit beta [Kordiimonas sp.]|nr:phenylalanine--tRNA ligase subunit beta [Kordiimonas sp.]|tara:strand:- start:1047 stop:3452 length:2406 start_codon:yes stop_codon:yes gene_type:complete
MKFTLSWLKDYLDTIADLDTILEKLTALGLEVEDVTDPAKEMANIVIAEVISAEKHPDADKLQVCQVNTGTETLQVVCGAPNARAGLKGAFAPAGTYIASLDVTLRKTKIRGVESNGMMCSERELELSDEHSGIIDLPEDASVGTPFATYAGLDDPVIEIAITPNRQDALGVYGIARDMAAAGLGTLKSRPATDIQGSYTSPVSVTLDFDADAKDTCPLFAGRFIRGVKNGPSPDWLQRRLKAIGLRPISTLVDITNYLTYDQARPLHVYDAAKLNGGITVRKSVAGEKFTALDDVEYTLDDTACVIADDNRVLGLGGIIGGLDSGCTEDTVDVFVESAFFDPIRTAMTGRKLSIDSDARYRFERGVDPEYTLGGLDQACQIILDLCGGEASEMVVAGDIPNLRKDITLRAGRVNALGGIDVPMQECADILTTLGFDVTPAGDDLTVTAPSWRNDIDGEADLVEEVLRIYGYDNIPAVPLPEQFTGMKPGLSPIQKRTRLAKRLAAGRGLSEAVTWSFLPRAQAELFGTVSDKTVLTNPISTDLDTMRPNLLPNLIAAIGRNVDRGFKNIGLFEAAAQYGSDDPADQIRMLSAVRRGAVADRHWEGTPRPYDTYSVREDALALLAGLGANPASVQITANAADWYHPGRSGAIQLGPKNTLAYFGEVHPRLLQAMDVKGPLFAFEIFLENIPLPKGKPSTNRGPMKASDFQAVDRDFAFIVDQNCPAGDLVRAIAKADKKLIEDITIFDLYTGPGVDEDKKSVALSVRLQAMDRTLTDKEIEAFSEKAIAEVAKATGGTLRQ